MTTLFKLTSDFKKIEEASSDDEIFQDTLDSIDWNHSFDRKVENYLHVIDNFSSDVDQLKKEEERLKKRRQAKEKNIKYMRQNLAVVMEQVGKSKVKTLDHTVSRSIRGNLVVVDESKVPSKFKVSMPDKLVKSKLNEAYKNGFQHIPGTEFKEHSSITIR